ncbi:unnamed protein product [Gordionus sp. m RMFG-2023]
MALRGHRDSGFLADESTDISGIEQMSLCARYLYSENDEVQITEDFLQFIPIQNMRGSHCIYYQDKCNLTRNFVNNVSWIICKNVSNNEINKLSDFVENDRVALTITYSPSIFDKNCIMPYFQFTPSVTELYIRFSNIQMLCDTTFDDYPKLEMLSLKDNPIKFIPLLVFKKLKLKSLSIYNTSITSLDLNLINGLPLNSFYISDNKLGRNVYLNSTNSRQIFYLTNFYARNTGIDYDTLMRFRIVFLPNATIYINNNNLAFIPDFVVSAMSSNVTIDFTKNPISCSCGNKEFFNSLNKYIKRQPLKKGFGYIFYKTNCDMPLNMRSTSVMAINESYFNGCKSKCFVNPPCDCMGYTPRINIYCAYTNIEGLNSSGLLQKKDLTLDLHLKYIDFLHFSMYNIFDSISIITLIVESSQMNTIYSSYFKGLSKNAKIIHFVKDDISTVPNNSFEGYEVLNILNLSQNCITIIYEDTFSQKNTPNLVTLDLSNNKLRIFIDIELTPSLLSINLSSNLILSISDKPFLNLRQLFILRLENNPITCDCNFSCFGNWMKNYFCSPKPMNIYYELAIKSTYSCHIPAGGNVFMQECQGEIYNNTCLITTTPSFSVLDINMKIWILIGIIFFLIGVAIVFICSVIFCWQSETVKKATFCIIYQGRCNITRDSATNVSWIICDNVENLEVNQLSDLVKMGRISLTILFSPKIFGSCIMPYFEFSSRVMELYIRNDDIQKLCDNSFDDYTQLDFLSLRNNPIKSMPLLVFKKLKLKILSITNTCITSLDMNLISNLPLEAFYMSLNNIGKNVYVNSTISRRTYNLIYFYAANTNIDFDTLTLFKINFLADATINLDNNKLAFIPNFVVSAISINGVINFTNNPISCSCGNKHLFVSLNKYIRPFRQNSTSPYSTLNVTNCDMPLHMRSKSIMAIDGNSFKEDCKSKCFVTPPCDCLSFTPRTRIYCGYTNIQGLSSSGLLKKNGLTVDLHLKYIDFSYSFSKYNIFYTVTIITLIVELCQLDAIYSSYFKGLSKNVKIIHLINDNISLVSNNSFEGFEVLNTLNLSQNSIPIIYEDTFSEQNTPNLVTLDLSYNRLRTFIDIRLPPSLTSINLSSNYLLSISNKPFTNLKQLLVLGLENNPIICDCNFSNFGNWMKNNFCLVKPTITYGCHVSPGGNAYIQECNNNIYNKSCPITNTSSSPVVNISLKIWILSGIILCLFGAAIIFTIVIFYWKKGKRVQKDTSVKLKAGKRNKGLGKLDPNIIKQPNVPISQSKADSKIPIIGQSKEDSKIPIIDHSKDDSNTINQNLKEEKEYFDYATYTTGHKPYYNEKIDTE